jgi:hypothetical protein
MFSIYNSAYDVIGVESKRIAIGFGGKMTAVVSSEDLVKI